MRQHKKILVIILLVFHSGLMGQTLAGKLLVVGGGSETNNGWSDAPYAWAVNQTANKRVAIIGTDSNPSSWLPNYFVQLGAVFAKNFPISSVAIANQQSTYDSLITYDMIFFRGGNQANYYNRYRNTLTQQATEAVFNRGGVIGGTSAGLHILSKVVYTALNGTVYPDEALANPHNQYMTLADNFLPFVPGVVFDSHVAERGRFGRILGFLGKWHFDRNEALLGIGVDDKTAVCIDEAMNATVYGTGAVSIYRAADENIFTISGSKLLATNIAVSQMIHGCSFHLQTLEATGLSQLITPIVRGNLPLGELWLSASDALNKNQPMLTLFGLSANSNDTIMIVTTGNAALATQIQNWLNSQSFKTFLLNASATTGNDAATVQRINRTHKFVFAGATYQPLMDFLMASPAGTALMTKLYASTSSVAFTGGNSRFAGRSVLHNYEQTFAGYDGLFDFRPGIGLLRSGIVMPNTFSSTMDVENTATGLPYGMIRDSLKYGIWLHDDNFVMFRPFGNGYDMASFGNFPVILLESDGTQAGLTTQSAVSSGKPRGIAGFQYLKLSLLDNTIVKTIDYFTSNQELHPANPVQMFPNPAKDILQFNGLKGTPHYLQIIDLAGRQLMKLQLNNVQVDISSLKPGIYLLQISDVDGNMVSTHKLVKQ